MDYEKWAKAALDNVVDDSMKDALQDVTKLYAKLIVKEMKGEDTATTRSILNAATRNWVVVGLVRSSSEAEDLAKKILESLGDVLVKVGKKALGF